MRPKKIPVSKTSGLLAPVRVQGGPRRGLGDDRRPPPNAASFFKGQGCRVIEDIGSTISVSSLSFFIRSLKVEMRLKLLNR